MSGYNVHRTKDRPNTCGNEEPGGVSLTSFSNIVIDTSTTGTAHEEDKSKLRVRFASMPSIEFDGDSGYKRKYTVALKSLKPFRPSSKDGKLPISRVGLLSYIFASWLSPLVYKMFRQRGEAVSEEDIWESSDEEGVAVNAKRFLNLWLEELRAKGSEQASVHIVWWRFMRTRLLVQLAIITITALATFLSSAFLLEMVVSYLESSQSNMALGAGLIVGMAACEITRACSFSSVMMFGAQTGTRVRSAIMGVMYDKLLKMRAVKGKTNSQIINVFSVDSYRVYMASSIVVLLFSVPVYLTIGTVYCYTLIGPWSFLSVGTFIACYCTQTLLMSVLERLRRRCAKFTDKRVRKMGEVLNNIKFVKMYAWEQAFNDAINRERQEELRYLLYSGLVDSITGSIIPVTPTIASVITISVYTAAGNQLTASTSFAVVGTMNFLRIIVALIPLTLRSYGEAKASFRRLKRLLLMEEFSPPCPDCRDCNNAIELREATFMWEQDEQDVGQSENTKTRSVGSEPPSRRGSVSSRGSLGLFVLSDINMDVPKGRLVGICGTVGGGKSSLMSAILGRMPMLSGRLAVDGSIAYVAQQAWIFNASIQDNILFGRKYDPNRYQEIVEACGLVTDFQQLSDGDQTEIGERGANLSGGQKQRVNLARAVYSNSDIYILDDPLSAVDVRVGKQLFHGCIKKLLLEKTVLLVTHQLQYLKHCDEVVVIEEGTVTERGSHTELLALNGSYTSMFNIFTQTTVTSNKYTNESRTANGDANQGTTKPTINATDTRQSSVDGAPGTKTKSSLKKKKKGRLVLQEEATVGNISSATYISYIQSAGGLCVAALVIFMYFLAAGSLVFSDWWLSMWISALEQYSVPEAGNATFNATDEMGVNNMSTRQMNETTTTTTIALSSNNTVTTVNPPASSSLLDLSLNTYLYVYAGSLAGIIFLQLIKSFVGVKAALKASSKLHRKCLDKVTKAPMSFFDSNPAGRVLNRFSKDLDETDVFIPQMTNSLLRILCLVILSTIMTALVTPWIFLAVVPILIVYYVMKLVSAVSIRQLKRLENIVRSPLLSHVNVTSQGLFSIVAYEQQERFFDTCKALGGVSSTAMLLFDVSVRWIGIRLDLSSSILTVVVALILVLTKGLIPPASAGLILSLCGKTVSIMPFLIRIINETEARFTSVERLNDYAKALKTEPQHATKMAESNWPSEGAVEFCQVVMKYRPDMEPVLRNVSFNIKPREKIGIIGRTGAGKSSLATVLFRLVELTSGQIKIDGEDISKLHLETIRSKVSTIPQDPVLFAGSLRYNIDPFTQYSDAEIWDALEKVHMKEKLCLLEEGLAIEVEENGENFSVGERQLLCLARAVLRSSKILLLDEATANIDMSTDAMIQETIGTCFSDCTVITIAHRLNTVLHNDRLLVMDAGQVMECASPQELLSNPNSFFNAMIASQSVKTPSP